MRKRSVVLAVAGTCAAALIAAGTLVVPGPAHVAPTFAAGAPATPVRPPQGTQDFVIDPQASVASYHVGETFFRDNRFKVAVGTTHRITGDLYVDRAHPDRSRVGTITVNVSDLTSDSRHRDNAIRNRWLDSNQYPTAVFTPTSIEGLPKTYTDGQTVRVRVAGNLTVHDVTKPEVFTGTLRLEGDILTGDVSTTVQMTDFGFTPPSIMMLQTENKAQLEFQFTAHPAAG
jgi:polyisoprenoid-binding protein YceI